MRRNLRNNKTSKKRNVSGRVCKKCGKDPYPNYFFCPSCHHKISEYGEEDDFFYSEKAAVHIEKVY